MGLPEGYTQIKYIQSSGSQYIDSNVVPNQNTRLEMKIDMLSNDTTVGIFGGRTSADNSSFVLWKISETAFRSDYGNTTKVNVDVNPRGIIEIDKNKNKTTINDTTVTHSTTNFTASCSLTLFAVNNNNVIDPRKVSAKMYFCKIYNGTTLIRDFIPCKNNKNVFGLYDLVNNKFYTNDGTGNFTGGNSEIYDLTVSIPTTLTNGDILNCPYSGAKKSISLPPGKYKLECWGAQGGYRNSTSYGGKGGYSKGEIDIKEETVFYLYTGGSGRTGGTSGGFNGGGRRKSYYGGGGASDIRINQDSLYARVIVAGGGGSDGAERNKGGGYGGGSSGQSRTESYGTGGYGGTQTGNTWLTSSQSTSTSSKSGAYAGFGFGGNGIYRSSGYGGAGGGGWYGGSGVYPDTSGDDDRGGGGGSGYIYTSSTAGKYPSGCLLNSSYYLTNASTMAGNTSFVSPSGTNETGHSENGYIRITVLEIYSNFTPRVNIGGTWKKCSAGYVNIEGTWKKIEKGYVNINGVWKEIT